MAVKNPTSKPPSPAPPKTESKLLKSIDAWAKKCFRHTKACQACYLPIVDAEGNPGALSEACSDGLPLLQGYIDAESDYILFKQRRPR